MIAKAGYRGQPLFVLAALLGGWLALRVMTWTSPFEPLPFESLPFERLPAAGSPPEIAGPAFGDPLPPLAAVAAMRSGMVRRRTPPAGTRRGRPLLSAGTLPRHAAQAASAPQGMAAGPVAPAEALAPASPGLAPDRAEQRGSRWSGEAWLLLRKDTTTAVTSGRGSYGQSQAGAVLRYRLSRSSRHRPSVYLRLSQALGGAKESEAAAGLSARPLPGIPVSAAVELRAMQVGGRTLIRPAGFAVTELPRFSLPLGFKGEAYAQAGYVGGDFATAFVDGQARAERGVLQMGGMRLGVGGGVWGGAQRGAERLDIGPGATLGLQPGGAPMRLSLDWRFRIAGDAEPSSGPTLTISSGF